MSNSADVSAGDDILASQYNNLRKDIFGVNGYNLISIDPLDFATVGDGILGRGNSQLRFYCDGTTKYVYSHFTVIDGLNIDTITMTYSIQQRYGSPPSMKVLVGAGHVGGSYHTLAELDADTFDGGTYTKTASAIGFTADNANHVYFIIVYALGYPDTGEGADEIMLKRIDIKIT